MVTMLNVTYNCTCRTIHLPYNWKFVRLTSFTHFHHPPRLTTINLCSVSKRLHFFLRFHIEVKSYSICLSLSDLFRLAQCPPSPSVLLQMGIMRQQCSPVWAGSCGKSLGLAQSWEGLSHVHRLNPWKGPGLADSLLWGLHDSSWTVGEGCGSQVGSESSDGYGHSNGR